MNLIYAPVDSSGASELPTLAELEAELAVGEVLRAPDPQQAPPECVAEPQRRRLRLVPEQYTVMETFEQSGVLLNGDLFGSITHNQSASPLVVPCSSPTMPSAGRSAARMARIAASASRSAIVTGELSGLSSTAKGVR